MIRFAHRLGAISYVLWALLHVVGGAALMATAASGDPIGALGALGSGRSPSAIPGDPGSVVAGVVAFHGWNILWTGVLVGVVAVRWTWRNTAPGFWLPAVLVGIADAGLVLFLLLPGEMSWADGIWGPILYLPALLLTGLARLAERGAGTTPAGSATGLRAGERRITRPVPQADGLEA